MKKYFMHVGAIVGMIPKLILAPVALLLTLMLALWAMFDREVRDEIVK